MEHSLLENVSFLEDECPVPYTISMSFKTLIGVKGFGAEGILYDDRIIGYCT
jgi:hypothetical protein